MGKPVKFDETGDSEDLQALFDSIAAGAVPAPEPAAARGPDPSGDSDDLQALFDSVVAQQVGGNGAADSPAEEVSEEEAVFVHLGRLARQLHDSLRDLGYEKMLDEDTARKFPDVRQRLTYIVQMTEQAAARVPSAVDVAKPIQDELGGHSESLAVRWDKMFANQLSVEEFKSLAADTRNYFHEAPGKIKATTDQLTQIRMAQDFQSMTGQVTRKVVDLAPRLEERLLQILIEAIPAERRAEVPAGLMNGPAAGPAKADDLLQSLGF